jgi:hypothetical protein
MHTILRSMDELTGQNNKSSSEGTEMISVLREFDGLCERFRLDAKKLSFGMEEQ